MRLGKSNVGGVILFGPAQLGEGVLEAREGQAHDVEVAAFDTRDEAPGAALDGVGTRFVVRFAGRKVLGDLFGGKRGEVHQSGLDKGDAFGVRKTDESHTGEDGVRAAGKFFQHAARVVGRARLAEDVAVEGDLGVRRDHDGRTNSAGGDEVSFGIGKALDEVLRRFARVRRFVDGRGKHREMEACVAQNFGAAG